MLLKSSPSALRSALVTLLFLLAGYTTSASAESTPEQITSPQLEYRDIPWAKAGAKTLTTDIYVPNTGRQRYPVVIIYHGGGWLINDNSIMESTARYLARNGEFVVANMNYRLLGDNQNTTTMGEIIGDALGGFLWVEEHISKYGGDPGRIAVTGDSAGGHLSAMVVLAATNLSSRPFGPGNLSFRPTYIPAGKTPEQIANREQSPIKAAVLSYGVFDLEKRVREGLESPGNGFWQMGGAKARSIFGNDISVATHPVSVNVVVAFKVSAL
ncbi:alpha/beta hydrolase [Microbulbifer sp. ARAS458-1]|uniref:alpha/beta hydrolase n=1 Tax=Microbulbifer sp. ARAS458-1 TaxID=3140242 RepID=UPI00387790F2